ncbi:MAG TPA: hypothetical protein VFC79_11170 [Tissierellaceae bacterium]|nr:hypothetical protein [Tissierellaceae bacterium]
MGKGTHLPQVLGQEEQETHISIDYMDREALLYTTKASTMRRLEKRGVGYYKEDLYNGKVVARSYMLPLDRANTFFNLTTHK